MMDIQTFVQQSVGQWRSQRSAHHLAFGHFEAIESAIEIISLAVDDPSVVALCKANGVTSEQVISPFQVSWKGHSDWDEGEKSLEGSSILVPVPDPSQTNCGQLLRDQGYAETMAAVGQYRITEDEMFVLTTDYDRAAAEEKIWFVNPNVRCRVSFIKTSAGTGVVTASFSSEIKQ